MDPDGSRSHDLEGHQFPIELQGLFFARDLLQGEPEGVTKVSVPVLPDGKLPAADTRTTEGLRFRFQREGREVDVLAFFEQPSSLDVVPPSTYTFHTLECSSPLGTFTFVRETCDKVFDGYRFVSGAYFGD